VPGCTCQRPPICKKLQDVSTDGPPTSRELSARDVSRIAEAFELPRDVVLADVALVAGWLTSDEALLGRLRHGHNWDESMGPFYLFWLRGDGEQAAIPR